MSAKRIAPALVIFVLSLVACDSEPMTSPASQVGYTEGTAESWFDVDFEFSLPIYLDCLDETLTWSGTGNVRFHQVSTGSGKQIENGKVTLIASTLTGPSGTWIDPKVMNHYNLGAGSPENVVVVERIRWTHESSGATLDAWTRLHIVTTGSGETKVLTDTEGPTCKVRS